MATPKKNELKIEDVLGHDNKWPKYTLSGKNYTRPASTLALGGGYFIVYDLFGNTDEEVSRVRDNLPQPKGKTSDK